MYSQELASKLASTERALSIEKNKTKDLQGQVQQMSEQRTSPIQSTNATHVAEEVCRRRSVLHTQARCRPWRCVLSQMVL